MSHTKNVAALDQVLGYCTGYGGRYNPVHPKLQISTMNALLANANQALREEKLARNTYNNVTNAREITFKELPKLASSMVHFLAASGASGQTLSDARLFFRKTLGRLKDREAIPSEEISTVKRRSGMLNFISIADNFERLVTAVSTYPDYQPNEEALKVTGLTNHIALLKKLNKDAMEARVAWSNGLISRDQLLYTNDAAICSTVSGVKKYVRAVFGLNSPEYAQIKKIHVTKNYR